MQMPGPGNSKSNPKQAASSSQICAQSESSVGTGVASSVAPASSQPGPRQQPGLAMYAVSISGGSGEGTGGCL
eukprot:3146484-Pleurochrysis_carterae.AAC.1